MRRRLGALLTTMLVITVAAASLGATMLAASAATAATVVYDADFPDPTVVREGAHWYVFATNGPRGNVQLIRSSDMRTWSTRPDALPNLPKWAEGGQTWAPAVAKSAAGWTLFYSARHETTGLHCLGRATSPSIEGPFVDGSAQPFVCQMDRRGSIDPSVFTDADGARYLVYKSEGIEGREPTRLWSQRLTPDLTATVGDPVEMAVTSEEWEEPIIEGPTMVLLGGTYWLLYAGNHWESPLYAIGVAKCAGPQGPCIKSPWGPLLSSTADAAGPGAPDIVTGPDGRLLLTFHAWDPTAVGYRVGGKRSTRALPLRAEGGRLLVGDASAPRSDGYRLVASDGGVFAFGSSSFEGSTGDIRLNSPIVGSVATPTTRGYWLVAADGGVFTFGDAPFLGSEGWLRLNRAVVGMTVSATGSGYWLVASDGGIFTHGDARFYGSTGAMRLNKPIVGMAATPTGRGYWLVASDGGIFSFGDARFFGSTGSLDLKSPIVSMIPTPWGDGYWLVAGDGGVFAFGAARFLGSTGAMRLNAPIVAAQGTPTGEGYSFVGTDGGVYTFGDAAFFGSTGGQRLNAPIIALSR